jgi:hypothetical protein
MLVLMKTNPKIGGSQDDIFSAPSPKKIKLDIFWDPQFSMPTGCTALLRQSNEGTQLLPFSAQSGGDKRVQELSFP